MWFFTTSFWINPPKVLIYSKKRGKSLLKFLFLLGDSKGLEPSTFRTTI